MNWPWDITFEVDFTTNPADTPSVWTDLSGRVRNGMTIHRGQAQGQSEGTSSIALNNRDRALDPTNSAATYNLVPMRHARLSVTVNEVSQPLFRGYVKGWAPNWPEAAQGTVTVQLVDGLAWVGLQEQDVDLPRQRTHDRINALLDLAGWPAGLRDIGDGVVWCTELEQQDANLLQVASDTADAEDGELYVNATGEVVFRSRHSRFNAIEVDAFGPDDIPVRSVIPIYDTDRLTNIGRVELDDGSTWEHTDAASVAAYGPRSLPVRDLPFARHEAVGLAQWIVVRFAEPHLWLEGLTAEGRVKDSLTKLLALDVGDLAGFAHNPPGPGTVDEQGHVEAIVHTVGNGSWLTSVSLSPVFGEGPWGVWLDAVAEGDAFWLSDEATTGPRWAP